MKARDITGQKFNMLTAVKFICHKNHNQYWLFKCDCGKYSVKRKGSVTNLRTKSCGCLYISSRKNSIISKKCRESNIKHGMARTRFYRIWIDIKLRCFNPKAKNFKHYGGRGILMCNSWNDFKEFKNDMYESYLKHVEEFGEKNTTIDRIDVNGNYEPYNCRWATVQKQNVNKRNTHRFTYNGETMSIMEWSMKLNVKYDRLKYKLLVNNLSMEEALKKL